MGTAMGEGGLAELRIWLMAGGAVAVRDLTGGGAGHDGGAARRGRELGG